MKHSQRRASAINATLTGNVLVLLVKPPRLLLQLPSSEVLLVRALHNENSNTQRATCEHVSNAYQTGPRMPKTLRGTITHLLEIKDEEEEVDVELLEHVRLLEVSRRGLRERRVCPIVVPRHIVLRSFRVTRLRDVRHTATQSQHSDITRETGVRTRLVSQPCTSHADARTSSPAK